MSWNRKNRLFGIVNTMRSELDLAEAEIHAMDDDPDTATILSQEFDADLETMRDRLGALEMRVQAIEGTN